MNTGWTPAEAGQSRRQQSTIRVFTVNAALLPKSYRQTDSKHAMQRAQQVAGLLDLDSL